MGDVARVRADPIEIASIECEMSGLTVDQAIDQLRKLCRLRGKFLTAIDPPSGVGIKTRYLGPFLIAKYHIMGTPITRVVVGYASNEPPPPDPITAEDWVGAA